MTTRTVPFAPGTPCWVDLFTTDVDGAAAFYGALFGWTRQDSGEEYGGYVNFSSDGHNVAGLTKKQDGTPMPNVWGTYFSVDDIAEGGVSHGGERSHLTTESVGLRPFYQRIHW